MFACAHGDCECLRLDACAGFMERMELALFELRVNDTEGVRCYAREVFLVFVVSLRMNASQKKKGFCLCCLSLSAVEGGVTALFGPADFARERPLSARRWNYSSLFRHWEVVLFSAAIKCAMYYVACLKNIHAIKLILLSIV